jgi:mannosyltransferase OCH1-like enzyme
MMQDYMQESWGGHKIFNIYNRAIFGPMKTDIFRYCLLFEKGGFYFDINKMCEKKISDLININDDHFLSNEQSCHNLLPDIDISNIIINQNNYFIQWGIGFSPKHLILKQTIDNICKYAFLFENINYSNPKTAILQLTGPGMFTKSIYETLSKNLNKNFKVHGIDYEGYGNYIMKGSWVRYVKNPSYINSKNCKILY